jgi:hypothetical protein
MSRRASSRWYGHEQSPQQFTDGRLWNRFDKDKLAGPLEAGEAGLSAELLKFAFRDRRASLHEGRNDLAPLFIGKTDDGHLGNRRMQGKIALDLDRRDILAAGDDHVVDAARHEQVAVLVEVTRVAGEIPALAQRFRVCVGTSPITFERLVARQQRDDLALFIGGREFVDRPLMRWLMPALPADPDLATAFCSMVKV